MLIFSTPRENISAIPFFEVQLFYAAKQASFSEMNSLRKNVESVDGIVQVVFDLSEIPEREKIEELRLDPASVPVTVTSFKGVVHYTNGKTGELGIKETNGNERVDGTFSFDSSDPMIILNGINGAETIEKIQFSFLISQNS